jgi:YbgC/YbaW family acyl-CoA thioester hydrolase
LSKSSRRSEHSIRRRVQFHETDAAGIVHFSAYFRYMEEAEHALWREAGLSIAGVAGAGFPRVAAAFEYHKPLRFEDEFDVSIRITTIAEKTIRYACVLTRADGRERIATGTLTIICVSKSAGAPMKAMAIPQDIVDRFIVADETGRTDQAAAGEPGGEAQ